MHPKLTDDLTGLSELLAATRDAAERALTSLDTRPVAARATEAGAAPMPVAGIGTAGALARFEQRWAPWFSGSAGPRYFGFVTGGATPASVAGDWLTSAYDQNAAAGGDSAAVGLERETVGWLAELFGLGAEHHGAFVTGATMSNFTGLAVAREWLGEQAGISVTDAGVGALGRIPVLSATPHSSVYKALSMLGIGREQLILVPTLPGREAVDTGRLAEALEALDGRPAIVVANAGTVNTVDFDNLRAIVALKERFPLWLHVDGAFGAFAALSPRHRALVDGLAEADSVCVDLHKWLNVPYDAAVQFTRRRDLQVAVFKNVAAYLPPPAGEPDYAHLTPENSRRLRALPSWFSLTAYGREGHQEIVERTTALAARLGRWLAGEPRLRLLAPVRLNVVCCTLAADPTRDRVDALVRAVADSGEAVVTPTAYQGAPGFRVAFSNWRTTESDVDRLAAALAGAAEHVAN
ncbi:pyridoxal-dependent decarboxylase [Amycolatopsis sp. YIM 10]|uniref:pyridoxal phosphate-dependent decarboxylase family protein n=1 Tax=Amycolatopsis sp. YIM 10 TaxID=2653857 RepID=UPI0012904DCD|nr:pyridoxal-dependent decarboxylase [Amycolatopsis sp. YIM 10]QFU90979.1 L-2,4-diaminobutyrate decarboxylase [Amycolatopsis sp. YIM 10]